MPELPEVETVRRILVKEIVKKEIIRVEVIYDRILENVNKETFKEELCGEVVSDILRKGKYLIIIFQRHSLVVHLRMEGKFFIKKSSLPLEKHEHIVFMFKDGSELRYHDTRKFGRFVLLNTTNMEEICKYPALEKLGNDANLETDYLGTYLKLSKLKCSIKEALLDQTIVAGIGNIYADEILFRAKIHPSMMCKDLMLVDVTKILKKAKVVLDEAINDGGTTIRSYTSSLGVTGRFQQHLLVHTKKGEACTECSSIIKKIRVAGRGTYYCPGCQRLKDEIKIVGITGVICSGKTTVTNYLTSLGHIVIDCDVVNREILNEDSNEFVYMSRKIAEKFPYVVYDGKIDRKALRNLIFNHDESRKFLEDLTFPIIKKVVTKKIRKYRVEILEKNLPRVIFLSAPLLFESKFHKLCNEVIVVHARRSLLADRIMERDDVSFDEACVALSIRPSVEELTKLCIKNNLNAFILDNSESIKELEKNIDKIIKKLNI